MTDLLNLPGYRVLKVAETDSQYTVLAETTDPKFPRCCLFPPAPYGTKRQCLRDTPSHGKFVDIWVKRRRVHCEHCDKYLYEELPQKAAGHRMTQRLFDMIVKEAKGKPFAEVARMVGMADVTVRDVLNSHIDETLSDYSFPTPRVLGIDEKRLLGKYRAVVGNIETKTLLDMRPNRFKSHLGPYLDGLDKDRIEVVCQDMWADYREVVTKRLPKAVIVVDKFHVMMKANDAVEKFRRTLNAGMEKRERAKLKNQRKILLARYGRITDQTKEKLEGWFARFPALEEVYWLKERFYDFYDAQTVEQAEARYRRWLGLLKPEYEPFFLDLTRCMGNWWPHIVSYFEHRYTNNYVESVNRIIDDLNRAGRGYEFEMIRAKALMTQGIHKTVHPKFVRGDGVSFFGPLPDFEEFSLGVDIDALGQALRLKYTEFTYDGDRQIATVHEGISILDRIAAEDAERV